MLWLLPCLTLPSVHPAQEAPRRIGVDCAIEIGEIAPVHGTNAGPLILRSWQPPEGNPISADFTPKFNRARVPSSRCHAEGPGDMERIWKPWPAYIGLNPDDPVNYDWTITDQRMDATYATHYTEAILRLGHTRSHHSAIFSEPPEDPDVFGRVCLNILRHYREGWDNGRNYDLRMVEVWNEPILWNWFTGDAFDYFLIYESVWRQVKARYGDQVMVSAALSNKAEHRDWVDEFFDYCDAAGVTVDAVSTHWYRMRPSQFFDEARNWREIYDERGYAPVPLWVTEWNRNLDHFCSRVGSQAFLACSMVVFNDLYVPNPWNGEGVPHMGISQASFFSAKNSMWTARNRPRNPGILWSVYGGELYGKTPRRILTAGSRSVHHGAYFVGTDFVALAGKAQDKRLVHILLSSYTNSENDLWPELVEPKHHFPVDMIVRNLPWGGVGYQWRRYGLRSDRKLELIDEGHGFGDLMRVEYEMFENTWEFFVIEPFGAKNGFQQ